MTLKTVNRDRVRVGVVGCGAVADYGHIPAIARIPEADLTAFAEPDPERLKRQMDKYGKPGFPSFEKMLEAVELDAVTITTQPDIKLDMVRIAAAHGLHAFCEKPLTDTVEQAEELMRLMDEAGLFVGVGFVYRGKQIVQRMMQLVHEGAIGKLRAVILENMWDYHGLRDQAIRGNRRHRALQNLGTLDCGVHDLDLARYFSGGEFGRIEAIGTIIEPENIYPDHIIAHSVMSNGILVSIEESAVWGYKAKNRPPYEQSYRLIGEDGVMSAHTGEERKPHVVDLRVDSLKGQWTEHLSADKAWVDTYRQFYQIILGREPEHRFIADGHDALINMRVAREIIAKCGW